MPVRLPELSALLYAGSAGKTAAVAVGLPSRRFLPRPKAAGTCPRSITLYNFGDMTPEYPESPGSRHCTVISPPEVELRGLYKKSQLLML